MRWSFYVTKPSKRAVRGAVLLAPASMQGRFCNLVGIISTVSKPLRYALRREYVCARGTGAYVPYAVVNLRYVWWLTTPAMCHHT